MEAPQSFPSGSYFGFISVKYVHHPCSHCFTLYRQRRGFCSKIQWWLNDFRLSKAIFLEVRTWGTQSVQKFGNAKETFLWTQNPNSVSPLLKNLQQDCRFPPKKFGLVPCHSGLLNRSLKTFRTGWTAHRMLSWTQVASSTQSEMPQRESRFLKYCLKILSYKAFILHALCIHVSVKMG